MLQLTAIVVLMVSLGQGAIAQLAPPGQPSVTPETGFVSREKYTNAFFGFALPLPQDVPIRDLNIPSRDRSRHPLFGLQSQANGLTTLGVIAFEASGDARDEAKKAVSSAPNASHTRRIQIGGKEFWKSESQQKTPAGKMRSVTYATALTGYTLRFFLISFDANLADEVEHNIESITFFDPATAKDVAGPTSHPYIVARVPTGSPAPLHH